MYLTHVTVLGAPAFQQGGCKAFLKLYQGQTAVYTSGKKLYSNIKFIVCDCYVKIVKCMNMKNVETINNNKCTSLIKFVQKKIYENLSDRCYTRCKFLFFVVKMFAMVMVNDKVRRTIFEFFYHRVPSLLAPAILKKW